jgi:hypothetical protein
MTNDMFNLKPPFLIDLKLRFPVNLKPARCWGQGTEFSTWASWLLPAPICWLVESAFSDDFGIRMPQTFSQQELPPSIKALDQSFDQSFEKF